MRTTLTLDEDVAQNAKALAGYKRIYQDKHNSESFSPAFEHYRGCYASPKLDSMSALMPTLTSMVRFH